MHRFRIATLGTAPSAPAILHVTRSVLMASFVACHALPVAAWQGGPDASPRGPVFESPSAGPQDAPEFPRSPDAITPLELETAAAPQRLREAEVPAMEMPRDRMVLPLPDTWDRSVETISVTKGGLPQASTMDDAAAVRIGVTLLSILGVAAVLAAVLGLSHRRSDGPVSVIQTLPPGRKGS